MKIRIAYLVTHPIQYQAPLLRALSADPELDITAFFCSDISTKQHVDPGFGRVVTWDVPLLEGYKHEFLPSIGGSDKISFMRPFNYGLAKRLKRGRFDVLWVHGYMRYLNWVAIATAKRLGMGVLIRDDVTLNGKRRGMLRTHLKKPLFHWLKQGRTAFLAVGTRNQEYYRHYGVEDGRNHLMPYAVDNNFFRSRAQQAALTRNELKASLQLEAGRPIILFAGKLIGLKRADDLLNAYKRLSPDGIAEPKPYLVYVGDGVERTKLESEVAKLNWNSVRFVGFKNQSELPRYFDLCDVFVLPSVTERFGLVVNEVMNAGKPIVVSDEVGCAPDLVVPEENGYVFRAGDIEALSHILSRLVTSETLRKRMGEKSLEMINAWDIESNVIALKRACAQIADMTRTSRS